MKKTWTFIVGVLISVSFLAAANPEQQPSKWAQPINIEGVPNLFKVSPELYRSAQPTKEGFENLKKLGIKTIVNLRAFHTDEGLLRNTGLKYDHIYMKAWNAEEEDAVKFLKIITDAKRTPVLVHCQHGADRTGTICAIYRIAVQGWTKEDALKEMRDGGFGFHDVWANLPEWIKGVDIETIPTASGIKVNK